MKKQAIKFIISSLSFWLVTSFYQAYAITGNMGVTLTIDSSCQISGATAGSSDFANLDFGTASDLSREITGVSQGTAGAPLQLSCTVGGLNYTASLDNGLNAVTNQRRMKSGTDYDLYQDAAHTAPWGTGLQAKTGQTSASAPVDLTVYVVVPIASAASAGTYSDTVQMTLAW